MPSLGNGTRLRIAASTKSGWCSANYVLDRFGSAARGDEAFQAGDAFGRLLLTRFLGAYLGDPAFRGMNDALLCQGESVHTLQRAIYSGPIGARHGRTPEQMAAISSGLTLLTNVIMTWNATRIGEVRARMPDTFPDHHIKHIAPNAHEQTSCLAALFAPSSRGYRGRHRRALLLRAGRVQLVRDARPWRQAGPPRHDPSDREKAEGRTMMICCSGGSRRRCGWCSVFR